MGQVSSLSLKALEALALTSTVEIAGLYGIAFDFVNFIIIVIFSPSNYLWQHLGASAQ
jgi:hypothetical protein